MQGLRNDEKRELEGEGSLSLQKEWLRPGQSIEELKYRQVTRSMKKKKKGKGNARYHP